MKSKIWPPRPRKWPLDLKDLERGSVNFSKKNHFLNQGKALRKMSYSSAFWSNFENYQFLTMCPPRPPKKCYKPVILKVWPESQAIAHFSQCFALILKMYFLEIFTEPFPRSLRSRGHFRGRGSQTLDFI